MSSSVIIFLSGPSEDFLHQQTPPIIIKISNTPDPVAIPAMSIVDKCQRLFGFVDELDSELELELGSVWVDSVSVLLVSVDPVSVGMNVGMGVGMIVVAYVSGNESHLPVTICDNALTKVDSAGTRISNPPVYLVLFMTSPSIVQFVRYIIALASL